MTEQLMKTKCVVETTEGVIFNYSRSSNNYRGLVLFIESVTTKLNVSPV